VVCNEREDHSLKIQRRTVSGAPLRGGDGLPSTSRFITSGVSAGAGVSFGARIPGGAARRAAAARAWVGIAGQGVFITNPLVISDAT
jgi:hypothetical protein